MNMKTITATLTAVLFVTLGRPSNAESEKPLAEGSFFNGEDLTGWSGNEGFWSVKDGAIIGHSDKPVAKNEFLWSAVAVADFHLVVEVKLTPDNCNAGIQFRSKKANAHGQAHGYQADVGAGVWGKLYHEHGRGKLDWNNRAAKAVKPGEWNRYEILAVGDRIWTAINGTICVAVRDPKGERTGQIALQIHGGPPQTVHYRKPTLTHDPPVQLAGLGEAELDAKLVGVGKPAAEPTKKPRIKPRSDAAPATGAAIDWSKRIAAADPGSKGEAWATPDFDDKAWKTMKLPGHFENAGLPDYDGVVWFRKTVELSAAQAGAKASVHLGQIDDMDVSWVNGKRVGGYEVPGAHFTVRNYPIPAGVLRAGENTIAVRVMDHGWPGGIAGKPEELALRVGAESFSLANQWRYAPGASLAVLNKVVERAIPAAPGSTTQVTKFTDGFALEEGDVLAFLGGSMMVKQIESGALEAYLTRAAGERSVYFRDISWQADTVYRQQRPRNFGTHAEMLDRVGATVAVAAFGQVEAMDGVELLPEFISAYEKLLEAEVRPRTEKIVLVTPFPFARAEGNPHLPDLTRHNASIKAYAQAIVKLAKRRGWIAVDLSEFDTGGLTIGGLQLTPSGHERWASLVTEQFTGEPTLVLSTGWDAVREQIGQKNFLWRRHWRPTNWAFLYGNRQTQPSSKDHRPGKPRWFPIEVDAIIPRIEAAQARIFELRENVK
jgi:hypothetical protein